MGAPTNNPLFGRGDDTRLSFLAPDKRNALRQITQDYDEMFAKFSAGGIQLPSDRERLKLLRDERDRDIAPLLTPSERAEYELRTSASASNIRARYGDAIETEADFRKLYALQVFPVMPAGVTAGTPVRQVVNIAGGGGTAVGMAAGEGGTMFFAPAPVRIENQVISVTTATSRRRGGGKARHRCAAGPERRHTAETVKVGRAEAG